jgi:hypothetical protein
MINIFSEFRNTALGKAQAANSFVQIACNRFRFLAGFFLGICPIFPLSICLVHPSGFCALLLPGGPGSLLAKRYY